MTQASRMFSTLVLISAVYFAMVKWTTPLGEMFQTEIIPVLPFWSLITFGAYLLAKLGWGVMTFNDVPEAHAELMKEIEVARADLRKKGVDVD